MSTNKIEALRKAYIHAKKKNEKAEESYKKRKGILKEGEWLLIDVYDYDREDNLIKQEGDPIIVYNSASGLLYMNACYDVCSEYICDILDGANHGEVWKARKISKEEALVYL
mgnify:CR=1 FL=1